jgi:hypothetical protein
MAKKSDVPTQKVSFAIPVSMLEDIRKLCSIRGGTLTQLFQDILHDGLRYNYEESKSFSEASLNAEPSVSLHMGKDQTQDDVLPFMQDVMKMKQLELEAEKANARLVAHLLRNYAEPEPDGRDPELAADELEREDDIIFSEPENKKVSKK